MTKKSNKAKKSQQEQPNDELDLKISQQMQSGFRRNSVSWTVKQLTDAVINGEIHDAPYQRGAVWDRPKQKALIETILRYGGEKIPTITLRKKGEKDYEVVDGKQRLLTSLTPFVRGEFKLSGIYNRELSGLNIDMLSDDWKVTYGSFMNCKIPLDIMEDMSDEEAITYFIQINSSGVNMSVGEKIHAMQGTPILKTLDSLKKHKVWENITRKIRYNEYWHISRMLLFIRDYEKDSDIKCYSQTQLLNELDIYRSVNMPTSVVKCTKQIFNFLNEIFMRYDFKVTIAEFFGLFEYTYLNLSDLKKDKELFGEFISGLYYRMDKYRDDGLFRELKTKHKEIGFNYTVQYYKWYNAQIEKAFSTYKEGGKWNDIRRLSFQ